MTTERKVAGVVVIYEDGTRDAFPGIFGRLRKRVNWTGDKGRSRKEFDEYEILWSSPKREVTRENTPQPDGD